jgi:SMODS-associating 2TM, beta-strand rich effector domain
LGDIVSSGKIKLNFGSGEATMHRYAIQGTDARPIEPWMFVLGAVSVVVTLIAAKLFEWIGAHSGLLSLLQAPSAFAIFGGAYFLFEKYLWRLRPFSISAQTPNLNGRWKASIRPLPGDSKIKAELCIHQTFRRISITIDTEISTSNSITASLEPINPTRIMLRNQYRAMPKAGTATPLQSHEGANNIIIMFDKKGAKPLTGTYYTEATRHTHGEIEFFGN